MPVPDRGARLSPSVWTCPHDRAQEWACRAPNVVTLRSPQTTGSSSSRPARERRAGYPKAVSRTPVLFSLKPGRCALPSAHLYERAFVSNPFPVDRTQPAMDVIGISERLARGAVSGILAGNHVLANRRAGRARVKPAARTGRRAAPRLDARAARTLFMTRSCRASCRHSRRASCVHVTRHPSHLLPDDPDTMLVTRWTRFCGDK
jgi:hypothetical protein